MRYANRPRLLRSPRHRSLRLLRSFAIVALLASGGCARHVVWSECPRPTATEEEDAEMLLDAEPSRPVSVYLARVIGHVFSEELRDLRSGEAPQ